LLDETEKAFSLHASTECVIASGDFLQPLNGLNQIQSDAGTVELEIPTVPV